MIRSSTQAGFTIIEILIAVTIFALLLTISVTSFAVIAKISAKNKLVQTLERDADAMEAHMTQNLKPAQQIDTATTNTTTNPNNLGVKITGNQVRRYYVTSGVLHYVSEAGADSTLLTPNTTVTALTYTTSTDATGNLTSVRIQGTLSRTSAGQTVTQSIATTVTMRPQ